ncbi:MAG TPA: glycoside hydrolase family 3 C-terminal domain-containing protein [Candidatus Acidoferrales bacterium]|nr:glycoside hydrolase family 3 C-terminal domain-containing protein [Candidatus Acidoferrales bacterium]
MRRFIRLVLIISVVFALVALAAAQSKYPFQNPQLPAEERITNLLSLMTMDEKLSCLSTNPSVPRLGVVGAGHVEGLHGLAMGGPGGWGVPSVVPTTQFPQAVGLGETWDPELLREVARAEGIETRYMFQSKYRRGGLVVRAPNADLARDIRWGRTEESYGEDAFLAGTMTVAFVKGLQGDDPHYWLAASLMKHFLANSNEDGRGGSSSNFDERLFREYYSVPFRMGIENGGSRAFMASYNAYNGVPMTVQPALKEIAVREWGNNGIMCTDAGAMTNLVTQFKREPDLAHAAAASVKAGINQFLDDYEEPAKTAIHDRLLTEADVDEVLRGVFRVMIRLGQLDPPEIVPFSRIGNGPEPWNSAEHKAIARRATRESTVLLKNKSQMLPLNAKSLKSIAIVGPYADLVALDWYSGTPPYSISAVQGIRDRVGPNVNVQFAKNNGNGRAAKIAAESDVAIVVVGNHPECDAPWAQCPIPSNGKEAIDRKSIYLEQEKLVQQVYAANRKTIVVLITSFPYAINWTQQHVPAILKMTHNSQELGNALADVLFGDYNPAGRLVHTWPKSIEQLPPMMDYDLRNGRTYMYFKSEPLYPFGFGLSYTKFKYENLRAVRVGSGDTVAHVEVDVLNTGNLDGDEVVQVYASYPDSRVSRPKRQLVGFQRIAIKAGEMKTVSFDLQPKSIAYWDTAAHSFVVESGKLKLAVGGSSSDLPLSTSVEIPTETSFKVR